MEQLVDSNRKLQTDLFAEFHTKSFWKIYTRTEYYFVFGRLLTISCIARYIYVASYSYHAQLGQSTNHFQAVLPFSFFLLYIRILLSLQQQLYTRSTYVAWAVTLGFGKETRQIYENQQQYYYISQYSSSLSRTSQYVYSYEGRTDQFHEYQRYLRSRIDLLLRSLLALIWSGNRFFSQHQLCLNIALAMCQT